MSESEGRLEILKTYKIYVNGKFPRTESGRYFQPAGRDGKPLANVSLCSRKDFRDAVTAARAAFAGWSNTGATLRGQILYRIAEVLEGRSAQFVTELEEQGLTQTEARQEVTASVERLVHYAGWSDKYAQIFSSVNPVASSHFNFSVPEPMGVVSVVAPDESPLLGLISVITPALVGGNTSVVLASQKRPLCAVTLGEVLATSDVPAGVVNILTGTRKELLSHMSTHMDVNAIVYAKLEGTPAESNEELTLLEKNAALNVKRLSLHRVPSGNERTHWLSEAAQSPYLILDLQETKTTWHPIGT